MRGGNGEKVHVILPSSHGDRIVVDYSEAIGILTFTVSISICWERGD